MLFLYLYFYYIFAYVKDKNVQRKFNAQTKHLQKYHWVYLALATYLSVVCITVRLH